MWNILKQLGVRQPKSMVMDKKLGFAEVAFKDASDTYLRSVHIEETYRNQMVGRPSKSVNEHKLREFVERAKTMRPGFPVLTIPCSEQHIRHPSIDVPGLKVPARDEFRLPRLVLIGQLECLRTKSPDAHISALTVVWFQDSPFPLLDSEATNHIQSYRWFDHALDIDLS
jgi:hypothetical protein